MESREKDDPSAKPKNQDKIVLVTDLLGFAALTEQWPLDVDFIKRADRLDAVFEQIFKEPNPLTHAFTTFHRSIRWALQLAQLEHAVTAITFSDSAFVATDKLFEAVGIGIYLMQSLMRSGVPMRAGIASGTFEAVRFRSDITSDGGDHAAHFLGTGVTRAHATETCGIKGCRLLLHPTASALLTDPRHNPLPPAPKRVRHVECPPHEHQNRVEVVHEVDYWSFGRTAEQEAWRALQQMWDRAPESEHRHYHATAEAINRMRMGQGESPMDNLRRRTLPRKAAKVIG